MEFKLKSEFIELDNLLKTLNLVASSAEAKREIQAGILRLMVWLNRVSAVSFVQEI